MEAERAGRATAGGAVMGRSDGTGWARQVLGEAGPLLREVLPQLVARAHAAMAAAHVAGGLETQHVYGLVWRRTVQEFAEGIPQVVPSARRLKVPHAGYPVTAVGDVAIYPWRYAKDPVTDPWTARLGDPPSAARRAIMRGVRSTTRQLALDLGPPPGGDPGADGEDLFADGDLPGESEAPAVLVALAELSRTVVVVRYASAPDALLRVLWGDGRLQDDGTVRGRFGEELIVPPAVRRRAG